MTPESYQPGSLDAITGQVARVLVVLERIGDAPSNCSRVGAACRMDRSDVGRAVRELERRGLVARQWLAARRSRGETQRFRLRSAPTLRHAPAFEAVPDELMRVAGEVYPAVQPSVTRRFLAILVASALEPTTAELGRYIRASKHDGTLPVEPIRAFAISAKAPDRLRRWLERDRARQRAAAPSRATQPEAPSDETIARLRALGILKGRT